MKAIKEDPIAEILKKIAPGTPIREGLDNILQARTGALLLITDKQDVISDLGTIRSGALDSSTALQSNDVANVALTGSYNDLVDKPTVPNTATSTTTITPITNTLVFTKADLTQESVNFMIGATASTTTTIN